MLLSIPIGISFFSMSLLQDLEYVVLKVNCISIILMSTLLIVECQLVYLKSWLYLANYVIDLVEFRYLISSILIYIVSVCPPKRLIFSFILPFF